MCNTGNIAQPAPQIELDRPVVCGLVAGTLVSAALATALIAPSGPAHAALVASVATPYLAFAAIDRRHSSIMTELAVTTLFLVAAILLLGGPLWPIALALALHAVWDVAHVYRDITRGVEWWAPWCASFDFAAAAALMISTRFS